MRNHDFTWLAGTLRQWIGDPKSPDPSAEKVLATLLLTYPGPTIVYGIPLGSGLGEDRGHDTAPERRDRLRQPIRFNDAPDGGWSSEPWLPFDRDQARNVVTQSRDPQSLLRHVRDVARLRQFGLSGDAVNVEVLDSPPGVIAYRVGTLEVTANLTDRAVALPENHERGPLLNRTDRTAQSAIDSGTMAPMSAVIHQRTLERDLVPSASLSRTGASALEAASTAPGFGR